MSSKNNTNFIDQKKKESQPEKNKDNDVKSVANKYVNFVIAMAKIILLILLSLLFGSSILYICKVATANILPTTLECSPYNSNAPDVTPVDVDVDINKINDKFYSTKINFPFNKSGDSDVDKIADYNRSNLILDFISKQKEIYNSWGIKMYFISIIEGLFQINYLAINKIFHFMNKNLYEFVVLLFGPGLFLFISPILSILTFLYSIYLSVTEFHWIFKENINTRAGNFPKWEDVTFFNPFNFALSCIETAFIITFLVVMYIFGFAAIMSFSNFIFTICITSALLMKSMISDGENIKQPYSVFKTFSDLLYSKMHYVMIIISLVMILLSFSYLGTASGIFAIVACFILFLGLVTNTIYNRQIPKDSTLGLASEEVDQAIRTCSKMAEGRGFTLFGGDKNILSELKKYTETFKNLNNN